MTDDWVTLKKDKIVITLQSNCAKEMIDEWNVLNEPKPLRSLQVRKLIGLMQKSLSRPHGKQHASVRNTGYDHDMSELRLRMR